MGTRGLYAYRHRGVYYTKYNHCDSYPEVLGMNLVSKIPVDKEKFLDWLRGEREYYDSEATRLRNLEEDSQSESEDDDTYYGYEFMPSKEQPTNDLFIEWVYVYDLDRMAFSVDNRVHFRLDNIPRGPQGDDWINFIDRDLSGSRCLSLNTPREYIADLSSALAAPSLSAAALAVYAECKPKLIDTSEWTSQYFDSSQELAVDAARAYIEAYFSGFSNVSKYSSNHPTFNHLAATLLYVGSPGILFIPSRDLHQWPPENDYPQIYPLAETYCFDIPHKRCWYRGCLIQITTHLNRDEILKGEVGGIIALVREKGLEKCTALLFSVLHVVVVIVNGSDVSHSAAIPIIDAYGRKPDGQVVVGLKLLAHYLRLPVVEPAGAAAAGSAQVPLLASDGNRIGWRDRPLPMDIFQHIVGLTDVESYARCARLSRACRAYCATSPRLGPYTILRRSDANAYWVRRGDSPATLAKLCWQTYAAGTDVYQLNLRYNDGEYVVPLRAIPNGSDSDMAVKVVTRMDDDDAEDSGLKNGEDDTSVNWIF